MPGSRLPVIPLLRQLRGDPLGIGAAARSAHSKRLRPRTATADRVVDSVCPYCAVGCGQKVYVGDERVIQIEGDPASPISRGRLCPKGAASRSLVTSPTRLTKVRYRRPHAGYELAQNVDPVGIRLEPGASLDSFRRAHIDAQSDRYPFERALAPTRLDQYPGEFSTIDKKIVGPLHPNRLRRKSVQCSSRSQANAER